MDYPETSILTAQPCAPPCWYGIVPGITGHATLLTLLRENPYADPRRIQEYPASAYTLPPGTAVVGWYYASQTDRGGMAFLKDDIVQVLTLDVESQSNLGDLVGHFGEPAKLQLIDVLYGSSPTPNSFYPRIEQLGNSLQVYYPDRGLVFHFPTEPRSSDSRASVQPDWVVDKIYLVARGSIDDIVSTAKQFQGPTLLREIYETPLQDWHRFGAYEILGPLAP